ncbi:Hint domain-containing protein [Sulfitobacter sp. SK011]|uniref:Hint domain-containing protein n=1 Tax=Sulfitobacter sp. SK011 TaxID=1389004 RepID=UPI000E0ABB43|nr:Hint domain-containing protein [Sulfitobacter sp. SK011]AXI42923.1 type I secretion protein [Sulfitobacter sp. SK011]
MADTTLLLNGFSIIGNPQSNTNASNGGNLFIHGGTAVFEADDIIVFTVTNVTANGTLTDNSVVTGVIVYDNATDYYYDIPKFNYSGTADIDIDRNSMGDRYLEFDASGLTSTDPGAPVLNDLAVVAGVNILATLASTNGPLRITTTEDIDLNADGIISPGEQGDGSFSSDLNTLAVICFAKGTLIETPDGPRYIETLKLGDLVNTLDNGPQKIRWIGSQTMSGYGTTAPVHIAAGALGNIRPLVVSQNHRMLINGARAELFFGQAEVLVAAKHLVDGDSCRIMPCASVSYYHFLFDDHQIVFAEGCPTESLYPGSQTLDVVAPDERDEIVALFPELTESKSALPLTRPALRQYEALALRQIA